jgi:hypothetical protein
VTVTFNNANPGNPAATGSWSGTVALPIVAIHVSQLPNDQILISDGQGYGVDARTWNTATNTFASVPVPAKIFCSGHGQMGDGRIFFAGGHSGTAHSGLTVANAFDPASQL